MGISRKITYKRSYFLINIMRRKANGAMLFRGVSVRHNYKAFLVFALSSHLSYTSHVPRTEFSSVPPTV
jgi:hypothetical protein